MEPEEHFTAPAGWSIRHFPETASTNDLAKRAGEAGAPERTIFVADHQTLGRGRMDRRWLEMPGSSLLFSILFRRYPSEPILLTMLCSVAACEAIEKLVADDEDAQMVLMAWSEGIRGKAAAEDLGFDMKRYDAARKRLERKLEPIANLRNIQ